MKTPHRPQLRGIKRTAAGRIQTRPMASGSVTLWLLSILVAIALVAGVAWCVVWWIARSD